MLIVRVELWPRGDSRSLQQIELISIVNVGESHDGIYEYEARGNGDVVRLRHRRTDGALPLVARAIRALTESAEADPLSVDANRLYIHFSGWEPPSQIAEDNAPARPRRRRKPRLPEEDGPGSA